MWFMLVYASLCILIAGASFSYGKKLGAKHQKAKTDATYVPGLVGGFERVKPIPRRGERVKPISISEWEQVQRERERS